MLEPRRRCAPCLGAQEHPPALDELRGGAASAQLHAHGRSSADGSQKRQRGGGGGGAAQYTAEQVAARRAAWTARQATPAVAALAAARAALPIAPFRQAHPGPPALHPPCTEHTGRRAGDAACVGNVACACAAAAGVLCARWRLSRPGSCPRVKGSSCAMPPIPAAPAAFPRAAGQATAPQRPRCARRPPGPGRVRRRGAVLVAAGGSGAALVTLPCVKSRRAQGGDPGGGGQKPGRAGGGRDGLR